MIIQLEEYKQILEELPSDWKWLWSKKKNYFSKYIQAVNYDSGATYAGEIRLWFSILYDKYGGGKIVKFFICTKANNVFDPNKEMWIDKAGKIATSNPITLIKLRILYLAWLALKRIDFTIVNEDAMYKDFLHVQDQNDFPIVKIQIEDGYLKYDVC